MLLSIAQEAAAIVGTEPPQSLFNKFNPQSILFLSLMTDTLEALKRYGDWQQLSREASFFITHEDVYQMEDIVEDFFCLTPDTIYIKDKKEKIIGSVSAETFMRSKVFKTEDGQVKFQLKGNAFCFTKRPPIGSKVVFQYRSSAVVREKNKLNGEVVFKSTPTKDTDIPLFDRYLIKLSLIWRWYKRNAMAYDEEFFEYKSELKKAFMTTQAMENISLVRNPLTSHQGGIYVQFNAHTE